jgi:hypothetical protein
VKNASGEVVRQLKALAKKGLKRLTWDMRHGTPAPVNQRFQPAPDQLFGGPEVGRLAVPGTYTVSISLFQDGHFTELAEPESFELKYLNEATFPAEDWADYDAFMAKVADLRKAVSAANNIRSEMVSKLASIQKAVLDMPAPGQDIIEKAYGLERRLYEADRQLNGDGSLASRQFETPPAISDRVGLVSYGMSDVTSAPIETYRESYRIAARQFGPVLNELKAINTELEQLEKQLELKGAPYTPGRWPEWTGQ